MRARDPDLILTDLSDWFKFRPKARGKPLTCSERQRRYRAGKRLSLQLARQAAMPIPQINPRAYSPLSGPITLAERTEWARNRVDEAQDRAKAHPGDSAYEVAYRSRLSELQALERVSA